MTIALVSCSNPWDDRKDSSDPNLDANLSEAIANTAELSQFKEILAKTGYDKVLSESKTYTVFAPTNEALAQVDASLLDTPEEQAFFVQNHIALTAYSSVRNSDVKIKMLSEKYLLFKGSTIIDDATIINADKYASNGVFHIVNKALSPKQNIWQYVNSQVSTSEMSKYLLSLKDLNIYASDATAKANTAPGVFADSLSNSFLKNVYNVNNEKNSYTLFLIDDAGYASEVTKLIPYFAKTTADLTATYARYFTVRDMVFPKAYKLNELPSELTTRFGVKVPIDKTQIVGQPIVLSNGIIYRMKKMVVPLDKRLVTTIIEGEDNTATNPYGSGPRSKVFYREKKDPSGLIFPIGTVFKDIAEYAGGGQFMISYTAKDLYSTTYKVYWRAVNIDLPLSVDFQQSLNIGSSSTALGNVFVENANIKIFPPKNVGIANYNEVYLGTFDLTSLQDIYFSLVSTNTTTAGNNSLVLDYLKFVPVIK
ncbi:hypothetical protein EM308_10645 [Flavobacterium gilvum]|uniref:FAS1 domain-containing protein n=2 Tax=Flavobacterium gilvum TaxID=1492737 RepID=A0AAC9I401_9FLAO|nr:hypothetical protein EM308_10645 [Flavobacterium gilvum]KFC59611.1 secreted/surface protein with fasciclin-like repeat containing protein [Flavobacterium gilvum]